jgi:hypothetical protein
LKILVKPYVKPGVPAGTFSSLVAVYTCKLYLISLLFGSVPVKSRVGVVSLSLEASAGLFRVGAVGGISTCNT